jgi:zinc protease
MSRPERRVLTPSWLVLVLAFGATAGSAQTVRDQIQSIEYEPLEWTPPAPERHDLSGVTAILLEDRSLPLVTVIAQFRGGYGLFGREWYAAALGLPALLRYGGSTALTPDSVEVLLEHYAMQTSFESAGVSVGSALNTLTEQLDESLDLWWSLIASPGFDEAEIDLWRGREVERVLRRMDDPGGLAYSAFNRLLYGDHSIGWELSESDLAPELLTPARLRDLHARIVCKESLTLGVAGDISWEEARPRLERLIEALPPCAERLPASPIPEIRRGGGVFVIERDLEQAVIIMAHPTAVRLADDPSFFAATIGNSILGGGGFSSRLLQRVRSDEGYAYSASSLWTTPRRYDGLIGAITRTSPENAVAAIDVILATMNEIREISPSAAELKTAVDRVVNGYVFNFQTPEQIVSRMMLYVTGELPDDWLERYAEGVQAVTTDHIRRVFAERLRPDDMTILIVGDPDRVGRDALARLGPVTLLEPQSPN